jgi:hypothetical protein
MSNNRRYLILGLLSAAAFLLALLAIGYERDDALAEGTGAVRVGPPPMVAVSGACGLGGEVSVLYVIDTEKKQLAIYGAFGGRAIEFLAARKIFYDFELIEFNDETPRAFSARNLQTAWEKQAGKDKATKDEPPRRR